MRPSGEALRDRSLPDGRLNLNEVLIKNTDPRPEPAARRLRRRGEAECAAAAGMTRIVEISRIRKVALRCFDRIRLETAAASFPVNWDSPTNYCRSRRPVTC